MHAGRQYSLKEVILWTRRETFVFVILGTIPTALYALAGWKWIAMPWLPVAMVGTAVAFITGFKNSASYSMLWEARQIWGAIVNNSRSWSMLVLAYVPDEATRRRLFYRHFAWLTALRFQLREPRSWENRNRAHYAEYRRNYSVAEWNSRLEDELPALLDAADLSHVLSRKNRALHLLDLQLRDIQKAVEGTSNGDFKMIECMQANSGLVEEQGKCERLKNFPYPRQYATLNHFFVWMFIVLSPFGLIQEFQRLGEEFVWLTIPASTVVAWVFHTMDKIGESTENPFEGGPNDVPITALARTIEIDMRELLGETDVPPALQAENNILM
jgi:ion channel-forming bestrophin family protein